MEENEEVSAGAGAHASATASAAGASAAGGSAGGEEEGCPAGMQKDPNSKGTKWVTPEKALQERKE